MIVIHGYSTLGAVALKMIERYGVRAPKLIEHVLIDGRCWIFDNKEEVSWMWWWFALRHRSDLGFHIETGEEFDEYKRSAEIEPDDLLGDYEVSRNLVHEMLALGVQPYQRILSTWRNLGSSDYFGERDDRISTQVMYIEPHRSGTLWLPLEVSAFPKVAEFRKLEVV